MLTYEILGTEPSVYQGPDKSIINGVLVRFKIMPLNEYHSLHIPKMNADLAHSEVREYVKEREALMSPPSTE